MTQLAVRQHGLVTQGQLYALGMSMRQIRWQAERSVLVLIRPRVYRVAGAGVTWEQAVLAAALSAGGSSVISHTTAAAIWSLRHSERFRAGIHITDSRLVRLNGVTGHRSLLSPAECTVHHFIPVTTVERTVMDLTGTLSTTHLGQCVDDALRRNLMSLGLLRQLVVQAAEAGGRRRLNPLHQVLADRVPGYRPDESDFETEMNRMWDRLRLPAAARQHEVVVDGHRYRIDRAIVECKIGIEWDSYRYHSLPSDLDYDSERRARLTSAGWLIIPVTGGAKPEIVTDAIIRACRDRGGPAL